MNIICRFFVHIARHTSCRGFYGPWRCDRCGFESEGFIPPKPPEMPPVKSVKSEFITWTLTSDQLPDDELLVLINTPKLDEPVWLGYYEDSCWHLVDGTKLAYGVVIAWADMPAGVEEQPA